MRERTMLMVSFWAIVLLFSTTWLPSMSWAGGWYLMVAPLKDSKTEHKPDLAWPLKRWEQLKSFDSASACEAARIRETASLAVLVAVASIAPHEPFNEDKRRVLNVATEQWLLGGDDSKIPRDLIGPIARAVLDFKPGYLCIATDDLRLQ